MSDMKKRACTILLVLLLSAVCFGFPCAAAAKDGAPVSMEVSSIYGDMGKMGVHIPVTVILYGQATEPFEGTVTVCTMENRADEGERIYKYRYPVKVNMAETRKLKLYIPLGQKSSQMQVILTGSDGREVIKKDVYFDIPRDSGRLLIGALTNREDELRYFDGVSLDYGMVTSRLICLDETDFPEDARGLEMLDILIINHYETERLSAGQQAALRKWVDSGGTLLIGTGAMVYGTLGPMAGELVEYPVETILYEDINLGAEYAKDAPGDADLKMVCARMQIPGGVEVEESDGVPLLTMVRRGDGQIGIFSYDLGEISGFVENNPSYANKMLLDVLGEDNISNIYYYSSYGNDSKYWSAQGLVNTGNADRLPDIPLYAVVIVIYILVVGPGLYLLLKKKDMSRYYGTSVVICSIAASFVVYLLGVETRFTSQFFTCATILETDVSAVRETTYLNVRTPDSRPYSVSIAPEYEVTPLTRTSRYDETLSLSLDGKGIDELELYFGEDETRISSEKSKAFESGFFLVSGEREAGPDEERITGSVTWFDGKVSGTIINGLPFRLENAALIFYGQVYPIGNLEAGEVLSLEEEELMAWPVELPYMLSEYMTGSGGSRDANDKEYLERVGRSNLYYSYLSDKFDTCLPDARLVGFGENGGILTSEQMKDQMADGRTLYAARIDAAVRRNGKLYRSCLVNPPKINTGNGSVSRNGMIMYGSDPQTVEYFIGTDIGVEKISFLPVSEEFLDTSDYYYLKRFDGTAYFYNCETRSFDRVNLSQIDFSEEELRPYISEKNSLTVKYTAGENDSSGVSTLLPHPMVTGREH